VELDGVPVAPFPFVRRLDFAQAEAFETSKSGSDGAGIYVSVPGAAIGQPLQAFICTPDQPVNFLFGAAAKGDGVIALNAGGLLLVIGGNENAAAGQNIQINNPGANVANLKGALAGT